MVVPPNRFEPGTDVVWRSIQDDHVGYVFAATVVADTEALIAIHQPAGAPILRRGGTRTGPGGRGLPPGGWDGTHRPGTFAGPAVIRAHSPGSPYSVIRRLTREGFVGWYVNLELPWTRTPIGYDSRDLTLDIVFADDLTRPRWKDRDEHDWNLTVGNITPAQHRQYIDYGHTALADAAARRGVFGDNWPLPRHRRGASQPQLPANATGLEPSGSSPLASRAPA